VGPPGAIPVTAFYSACLSGRESSPCTLTDKTLPNCAKHSLRHRDKCLPTILCVMRPRSYPCPSIKHPAASPGRRAAHAKYNLERRSRRKLSCSRLGGLKCLGQCRDGELFLFAQNRATARKTYRMRDEAKADVFDYIERFYNAKRRH
jgi:hypothetical protein